MNYMLLHEKLLALENIRSQNPKWGLPELLMPSFEDILRKSSPSFKKIMPELFHTFSESDECGVLLCNGNVTFIYGFGDDQLHIWFFT